MITYFAKATVVHLFSLPRSKLFTLFSALYKKNLAERDCNAFQCREAFATMSPGGKENELDTVQVSRSTACWQQAHSADSDCTRGIWKI